MHCTYGYCVQFASFHVQRTNVAATPVNEKVTLDAVFTVCCRLFTTGLMRAMSMKGRKGKLAFGGFHLARIITGIL